MRYYVVLFFLTFSALFGAYLDGNGSAASVITPVSASEDQCSVDVGTLLQAGYRYYPTVHASRAMLKGAEAQMEGAKWNYFPTPSVEVSQRPERRGVTLRLDQPLWTGGKLDAQSDYAASQDEEAQYSIAEQSYALAEKFISLLQDFLQAKGEMQAFEEGKAHLSFLAQMLDRRIAAGVSADSDRELLHSRVAQIESDLIVAQSRYRMSRAQMELLIGQPLQCTITYDDRQILQQTLPLQALKEALLQFNPSLKRLGAQVKTAQAEKLKADAAPMPNLSVRAEYQDGSIYVNNPENSAFVYMALSFNPGAGLSAFSEMERAASKIEQTRYELRAKEEELKASLVLDYTDYHKARNSLESMQRTINASEQVLESYTRLFIAGKRQWLDLVNTSRELTQYEVSLAGMKALLVGSAYRLALQSGQIALDEEQP